MKQPLLPCLWQGLLVAPRRGAWIETYQARILDKDRKRRTPQGCVD